MTLFHRLMEVMRCTLKTVFSHIRKRIADILMELRLVLLNREHIVGSILDDRPG